MIPASNAKADAIFHRGVSFIWRVILLGAAMIETFRAFLYGVLILVTALIPPAISLIEKFGS